MKTIPWLFSQLLAAVIFIIISTHTLSGQQQVLWQKIPFDSNRAGVNNVIRLYTAPDSTIYAMTTDRAFGAVQYMTTPQAQRLYSLNSTGTSWLQVPLPSAIKIITSVQQTTAGTLFITSYSQDSATSGFPILLRSVNKGLTWTTLIIDNTTATAEVVCTNQGWLYTSVDPLLKQSGRISRFPPVLVKVLRSKNEGLTWDVLFQRSTSASIYGLAVSNNSRILLATEEPSCGPTDGKIDVGREIVQSQDTGKTWRTTRLPLIIQGICSSQFINFFAVNSITNQIVVSASGITLSSFNGIEWIMVKDLLLFNTVIHQSTNTIFMFSGFGINRYSNNFSEVAIIPFSGIESSFYPATLAFGKNNRLYMGGFNTSSAYSLDLNALQPTSVAHEQKTLLLDVVLSPNPVTEMVTISFSLPVSSPVRIMLHDALGREVMHVPERMYAAGAHEISLAVNALPSGIYFLQCSMGGRVVVRRLAAVR
jgi:Secretion system C-terminal sorting domain